MFAKKRLLSSGIQSNKVLAVLTTSDILAWGSIIFLNSIVGIFLLSKFQNDIVFIMGLGGFIYFITRGIAQLPVGFISDKIENDRDEIFILLIGTIILGLSVIGIVLVTESWQYYLLQFMQGIGASMNLNGWRKLFAKNLDKTKEGIEYGIYEFVLSISTAIFSLIAGLVASLSQTYFEIVIVIIGILIILGGLIASSIFLIFDRKSHLY